MAKNKKKLNEKSQREDSTLDKEQREEGDTKDTTTAEHDEETYEAEQSRPGNQRNDRKQTDPDRDIYNEDETLEAAREAGDEPVSRKEQENNRGTQAMRDAKRNRQSPPSARVTRKEPSKASARGNGKSRTATTRTRMQGKKKSSVGRGAAASANRKTGASKSKSKTKTGR